MRYKQHRCTAASGGTGCRGQREAPPAACAAAVAGRHCPTAITLCAAWRVCTLSPGRCCCCCCCCCCCNPRAFSPSTGDLGRAAPHLHRVYLVEQRGGLVALLLGQARARDAQAVLRAQPRAAQVLQLVVAPYPARPACRQCPGFRTCPVHRTHPTVPDLLGPSSGSST